MVRRRFFNSHLKDSRRSVWDHILWKFGIYDDPSPRPAPAADFVYPASCPSYFRQKPSAVWIGHSTYLIEVDGLVILTDPVWSSYCSPLPMKAFRRQIKPPIALAELPPIDIVLLSHNHYDHLDAKTVKQLHLLYPQIAWIVPEALSSWFHKRGIYTVTEIGWWQSDVIKNCKITAVPAQHYSRRSLFDHNKTHWNGYVVQTQEKTICFTGDTGYNSIDFKEIGHRFPHIDLSLIPIGTYAPARFMQPVHINPFEAVEIHRDVKSRLSLGMHWNTFCLSEEPRNLPPYDLYLAMKKAQLPFNTFLPIDIGTYINF